MKSLKPSKEVFKLEPRIKSISIHAFRGIPSLELPLEGKSLVIKGENGTGKSSIVESFEFLFTGKLSIFEGEGTQNLSLLKHAPHSDYVKDDVLVRIVFSPNDVTVERTFSNDPKPPVQLKDYFETAGKGTFILRRSQILKFIASVPSDRFRAIASILGVEQLDNIELAMKRAHEELDEHLKARQQRIQTVLAEISALLGEDIAASVQVLPSLNKRLTAVGLTPMTSLDRVDDLTQEMLKTFRKTADLESVTKLGEISDRVKTLRVGEEYSQSVHQLDLQLTPFLEAKAKRELSVNNLLIIGKKAVEEDERGVCPLCGQSIDREELLKQIDQRLNTLSQLSEEASQIRRTSVNLEEKLSSLINEMQKVSSDIESYKQLKSERLKLDQIIELFKEFASKAKSAKELDDRIPVETFRTSSAKLNAVTESLVTKCQSMLNKIGVPDDWKNKVAAISIVSQVKGLLSEITQIESDLKTEEQQSKHAETIYKTFSETKKNTISEIYESIMDNVNSFYSTLHPQDPHKNIELKIATGKRASADLKIESFEKAKEDPRAFTSEAHQDSLGLCIFLAFVKKFNKRCNFIVLDDVVTTIDAQHRELICTLLLEQFRDYQLMITTHDGVWYEQLRSHQRAFRVDGEWRNLEIVKWTLKEGPTIESFRPRWDKIKAKIDVGDKQGAASEGRNYVEWLLKEICKTTLARVIIKERYTVADLSKPAKERIDELTKGNKFQIEAAKRFQQLEATAIMGNLLTHDNPEAENVSIAEVNRFCEAVHDLHTMFICPSCGSFLRYYQDMKKLRCPDPHCHKPIEIACN